MNEAPYTVERRLGGSWVFFSAWPTYEDAMESMNRLLATGSWSVRIRRNNELIYTNDYDRHRPVSQDPLAEWRKKHVG